MQSFRKQAYIYTKTSRRYNRTPATIYACNRRPTTTINAISLSLSVYRVPRHPTADFLEKTHTHLYRIADSRQFRLHLRNSPRMRNEAVARVFFLSSCAPHNTTSRPINLDKLSSGESFAERALVYIGEMNSSREKESFLAHRWRLSARHRSPDHPFVVGVYTRERNYSYGVYSIYIYSRWTSI